MTHNIDIAGNLKRRTFLARAGLTAASAVVASSGVASGGLRGQDGSKSETAMKQPAKDTGPLFSISLAQWSLHRELYGGQLTNLDFPGEAKKKYGIDAVEFVNQFFIDKAGDDKYIAELNRRASDAGVRCLLIMCDGLGALGDADKLKRIATVENHKPWVEAAKSLGCHSIRVNAQSSGSFQEQAGLAADGLRRLTEYAEPFGINVIVENHGGLSSSGKWLSQTIRLVDHPMCGTLPDFGNFRLGSGKDYDRYLGVTELMPFAKAVSAKSHEFDSAGNEVHTDYLRMMKIVLEAGYRGYVGVEYEGNTHSEAEGIVLTRKLLEQVRAALTPEFRSLDAARRNLGEVLP